MPNSSSNSVIKRALDQHRCATHAALDVTAVILATYDDKTDPSAEPVDQGATTDESLAMDKLIGDICYAIAKQYFVRRTASPVMSHLQVVLGGIGTILFVLVLVFIAIV
ncbi:hypothetical protein C8R45DRAFT_1112389 [Mycena sanguinolenta]|nr:hypothetical protein C8R45DRAFT_1112389 [Mycena sanguinolenta]